MKSNKNKKSIYGINILIIALIFIIIPTVQAQVTAERSVENNALMAGNSTNITVVIQNDDKQRSLSLQEIIPSGWNLTKISDDATDFKASTNEWIWIKIEDNTAKTVIYQLTVPSTAASGVYNINGNITTDGNSTSITGDNSITVSNEEVPPSSPSNKFTIVSNRSSKTVNVGTNATYILTLTNTGSSTDTYTITEDNADSNVSVNLNMTNVTVESGKSSMVELMVNSMIAGTYDVNVSAMSDKNNSNIQKVMTSTTVEQTVPGSFSFDVEPSSSQTINIGESATYTFTITNIGGVEDTYVLAVNNSNNDVTANLDNNSSITILPGNNSFRKLMVSGSVTGTFTVGVTATSEVNSSNVKNIDTMTTMTTVTTVTVPYSSGSGGSSGEGTYPTFTATPQKTVNVTAIPTVAKTMVAPTVVTTEVAEVTETIEKTPIVNTTKSPGFEILIAIGMFTVIYILRKIK